MKRFFKICIKIILLLIWISVMIILLIPLSILGLLLIGVGEDKLALHINTFIFSIPETISEL